MVRRCFSYLMHILRSTREDLFSPNQHTLSKKDIWIVDILSISGGCPLKKVFVHPKKSMPKIQKIPKKSKKSKKFGRKKVQNPRKQEKIRIFLQKSPNKVQKIQKS